MLLKIRIVSIFLFTLFALPVYGADTNILVLYNYQNLQSNTVAIGEATNQGILSVIPEAKIFSEYYDRNRFKTNEYTDVFYNYLLAKYKKTPPAIIFAHLETAFIAFKLRDAIAPKSRVLFDLPLEEEVPHLREGFDVFLPLEAPLGFEKNLELYRKLFPDLRNVYLISDEHPLSKIFVQKLREAILKTEDPLNLTVWLDDDISLINKRIKKLSSELSLVVLSSFARRYASGSDSHEMTSLINESPVPIMILEDRDLGDAVVGGYLFSYKKWAYNTGYYLGEILTKSRDAKLKQGFDNLINFKINNKALKRFGVNEDLIPKDVEHINRSMLLLDTYHDIIIAFLFVLLVGMIFGAWIQFKKFQNEKRFRSLFDETAHFWGILDSEGRILDASKTALRLIDKRRSEVKYQFFWDTPWWTQSQTEIVRLKQGITKCLNGEVVRFNTYHIKVDGSRVEVDFSLKPIKKNNKIIGLVAEGRDITDKVAIEKSLKENEEIFHSLFVHSPDPSWIIENNVFVECNSACVSTLGYSDSKEVLHLHPSLLSPPVQEDGKDSHDKADEMMALCMEKGNHSFEWLHKRKNGEIFSVAVSLTRVNLNQRTLIYCTWRDISIEKKQVLNVKSQIERLHIKNIQADRSNKIKSALLRCAGLEMRDPLTSIIGATYILQESGVKLEQEGVLRMLSRSTTRLTELINTLLDLSLIEEHKVQIVNEPFSLKKEIDYLRKEFSLRAIDKGLLFEIIEDDELLDVILGDKRRLRQVLYQLLDNAIKFTETGSVTLKIGKLASDPGLIQFAVIDTGIGIPKYNVPNLFDSDSCLNKVLDQKIGTGGLGLGMVQELVKRMGGEIGILSSPSTGTTIHFAIGLKTSDLVLKEDQPIVLKNKKVLRVLIADDSDETRAIYFQFLKKTPHHIDFSSNGSDALERFKREHYDVILLDIQMPHLTGYEVVREIRKIEREKNLVRSFVVAATVHAFEEDKLLAYDSGFDLHLSKPVDKNALLNLFEGFKD